MCFIIKFWWDHRMCINIPELWPTVISAPAVTLIPLNWFLTTSFLIPRDCYPPSQLVGIYTPGYYCHVVLSTDHWEQVSHSAPISHILLWDCNTFGCHTTTVGWDFQPWEEKIPGFTTLPLTRAQHFCLVVGMSGSSRMLERNSQSRVLRHLRWSALVMWVSLCPRKQASHWGPNYHPQNKKCTNKEMKQKPSWQCKRETIQ